LPDSGTDRLALRELVDAYAHRVDRRDLDGVAALFTEGGRLIVYDGEPGDAPPLRERHGRAEISAAMERLRRYDVTTHFLGQQTVTIDGDRANGETYCLAHHLADQDGRRINTVMSIRYLDSYVRTAEGWLIDERRLALDWVEDRPIG
jgi:hypothetical protein